MRITCGDVPPRRRSMRGRRKPSRASRSSSSLAIRAAPRTPFSRRTTIVVMLRWHAPGTSTSATRLTRRAPSSARCNFALLRRHGACPVHRGARVDRRGPGRVLERRHQHLAFTRSRRDVDAVFQSDHAPLLFPARHCPASMERASRSSGDGARQQQNRLPPHRRGVVEPSAPRARLRSCRSRPPSPAPPTGRNGGRRSAQRPPAPSGRSQADDEDDGDTRPDACHDERHGGDRREGARRVQAAEAR